jgi:hypothetical protein
MQRLGSFLRWFAAASLMASAWLILGLPAMGMLLGTRAALPLPARPASPVLRTGEVLADLHQVDAARKVARMCELNPDGFEAAWLSGLIATDPVQRAQFLNRALALQPAYPADREAIHAALAGGDNKPGERTP